MRIVFILTVIAISVLGFAIGGLGMWLLVLGGSPYYLAAGIILVCVAGLLLRGSPWGPWLYTLLLAATLIWALKEAGLDGWAQIPRLVAPAVLGLWIWSPWIAGRIERLTGAKLVRAGNLIFAVGILIFTFASGYWITGVRTMIFQRARRLEFGRRRFR